MFALTKFAGEMPRVAPRLLPDTHAQVARNCRLVDGQIVPLRTPTFHRSLAAGSVMFYKRGDQWVEWSTIVDVAPAPVAANRLYVTGDGPPKIVINSTTTYNLAVPKPAAPLVATVGAGVIDPATQATFLYVYTYVTSYDEESEPSPLSNEVLRSPGISITLTGFAAPPYARGIDRMRIYRSQTSLSGSTTLYLIQEVALATAPYVDPIEGRPIQEPLPSASYNAPPAGLSGLIPLPNGMMAGFVDKRLYISEPWRPHAWPEKYVLTTDFEIVGLGAFGQSIAVLTKGNPYVVTGLSPDSMAMERLEVNFPCVAKRGIVDLGYTVVYPSPDGLVSISQAGASLVSRTMFAREQWQALRPSSFVASQFDGRYIVSHDTDAAGVRDTMVVDLTGEQPFITHATIQPSFMFFEIGVGVLYYVSGTQVLLWDPFGAPPMQATWRSKPFIQPGATNFGAVRLETGSPAGGGLNDNFSIFADGVLVRSYTTFNKVHRIPGGFKARSWEVEYNGKASIAAMTLAPSPGYLSVGGKV